MTDTFLRDLSIGVIALSLAVSTSVLIGASAYDYKKAKNSPEAKVRKRGPRPLVSTVIYSQNQAAQTVECVENLLKSSHRKLELVIINNSSSDDTKAVLKQLAIKRAKRSIKVINKRKPVEVSEAVRSGLKAAKGDVVLLLTPETRVGKTTIADGAQIILACPEQPLIPANLIACSPSTLGLWLSFKSLLRSNWQKTASLTKPTAAGIFFGVFYSRQTLKDRKNEHQYIYEPALELLSQPSLSLRADSPGVQRIAEPAKAQKKSAIRPIIGLVGFIYRVVALPIFAWYGLYLAMNRGYSFILFLAFSIFTFIYIFVAWTDEHMNRRAKARMILLTPAVFSLSVVMVFVESVARLFALVPLASRARKA